jgi:hypothetical protein
MTKHWQSQWHTLKHWLSPWQTRKHWRASRQWHTKKEIAMDLPDLSSVSGNELSADQLRGIIAQVDLDIVNLLRDGKLSALKYGVGGAAGQQTDRAANLRALVDAREHYQKLLESRPGWEVSRAEC